MEHVIVLVKDIIKQIIVHHVRVDILEDHVIKNVQVVIKMYVLNMVYVEME